MNVADVKKSLPDDFYLLCGCKPDTIGVFVPGDAEAFGGFESKTRLVRYCLCDNCKSKKDALDRIEKVIRVALAGGGAIHV